MSVDVLTCWLAVCQQAHFVLKFPFKHILEQLGVSLYNIRHILTKKSSPIHVTAIMHGNVDLYTVTRYNRPNNVRGENKLGMADNELLTVEEVAKEVKVHAETVRSWIRKRELPAIDIGGEYRIYRRDLEDFLQHRKTTRDKESS